MLTGAIRSQVDRGWELFRSGVIASPLTETKQIIYLLFAKPMDDLHITKEKEANLLGVTVNSLDFDSLAICSENDNRSGAYGQRRVLKTKGRVCISIVPSNELARAPNQHNQRCYCFVCESVNASSCSAVVHNPLGKPLAGANGSVLTKRSRVRDSEMGS